MEPGRPRADQREKSDSWTFLILPKTASTKLPSRGMTAIEGTINGVPFQAVLEPDGQKSHWLKVDRKLREAAGADAGGIVSLEIAPAAKDPEPTVPADLRKALAAAVPKARALWSDIIIFRLRVAEKMRRSSAFASLRRDRQTAATDIKEMIPSL